MVSSVGRLDESLAVKFLSQLTSGLLFLSEKNIIHRDLKPANILLNEDSENAILKIADFGFARQLSEAAAMVSTQCGTPLYMAPEIFDQNDYDSKADVWSTGCVFYEMLVGKPPFEGANPKDLLKNIKTKALSMPKEIVVSKAVVLLLRQVLHVDPAGRSNLEQLRASVQQLLEGPAQAISSAPTPSSSYTAPIRIPSNLQANLQSVANTPPTARMVAGSNPSPATITFAMNLNSNAGTASPYQNTSKAGTLAGTSSKAREDDSSGSSNRRFSLDSSLYGMSGDVVHRHDFQGSNSSSSTSQMMMAGSPPVFQPSSFPSQYGGAASKPSFSAKAAAASSAKPRSISLDSVSSDRILQRQGMLFDPSSGMQPSAASNTGLGSGSWNSSGADEDFVMVENNVPLTGRYTAPPALSVAPATATNSSRYDAFLSSNTTAAGAGPSNQVLQSYVHVSKIIAKICAVGDRFVPSSDGAALLAEDEEMMVVDRYQTAISIYQYALATLREVIIKFPDSTASATSASSSSMILDRMKQDLLLMHNQLISRIQQCQKQVASSTVVAMIPAAEPILYCLAMKLARDAWVEMLLGNVLKAMDYYADSKLLIDCLVATTADMEDKRLLQYYAQSIAYQLELSDRTRSSLLLQQHQHQSQSQQQI
jgi:serine/threonine protein kinase